jgi:hypothetical protein
VPDLDAQLARSRDDLFDEITQPPLATVQRRAGALRRRKLAVRSGAAAVALAGLTFAVVPGVTGDGPPPVAAPSVAPTGAVYRDDGITINGLTSIPLQLDGSLDEVEFVDQTTGYVLTECADGCRRIARTTDGGATFTPGALPPGVGGKLDLVGFPGGGLVLVTSDGSAFTTRDGGTNWQRLPGDGAATVAAVGAGQILRYDGPRALAVWSATGGRLGTLARFPGLDAVRWVAPAPSGDGAWWVGGTVGGEPAVAVSRDAGASWDVRRLGAVGATVESVRVSTLGPDVYAVVTGPGGALLGIFHSTDSGAAFARTWTGGGGGPAAIAGDVVPLLDGRLLAVSPGVDDPEAGDWWLSADDGRTFTQAKDLPVVGRIDRTVAGYVANDFFREYAAFSRDGATWRKLEVW